MIVAAGFVALVVAAAIAGDGGFALAVGLVLIGLIAMFVPMAVIQHEQVACNATEMADLIAYLHGGCLPSDVGAAHMKAQP
jgi:hypothetical protein